jgi:plastocyanin
MDISLKHLSSFVVGLLFLASVVPAGAQDQASNGPKVQTVEISPKDIQVHVGDKVKFSEVAKDANGSVVDVKPSTWFAAPFDLAGSDPDGTVLFHQPGEVTVGAVVGGKTGYAHVNVLVPNEAKLEVAPVPDALVVGGKTLLSATVRFANGDPRTDLPVRWSSKSPDLATVDNSGMVTGVKSGSAMVVATAGPASAETTVRVVADQVRKVDVSPATATARTGDVVHFSVKAAKGLITNWSVTGQGASVYSDGAFVAELPGTYQVTASIGSHCGVASITVAPRNIQHEVNVVSHIAIKGADGQPLQTSEEWVIGNYLYVATVSDRVFSYDISDPANPKPLDSMKVDARLINDISTTPDQKVGVFTREGASNRKNGIVFFDASDPSHLKPVSEYTETVTGGVHSAFINKHYAYITDDATGSLRVIDFQDPAHPREVARWQTENATAAVIAGPMGPMSSGRYLHDLYVKDGLAFLAYWRDGLVILDVGNGIKGGSPEHPQLVSQFKYNHHELYGNGWLAGTHAAFRYKNYLFMGDEVFPAEFELDSKDRIPVRGILHVMEISDLEHPREVANYEVPEGGIHNIWADNDILYAGDYSGGGRVIDISGELRGNLYQQGREMARLWTGDPGGFRPNLPFSWGAQPANGLIFYNDINTGIWIAKIGAAKYIGSATIPPLQVKSE